MNKLTLLALLAAPSALAASGTPEQLLEMQERQAEAIAEYAPDCEKIGKALLARVHRDAALMKKMLAEDKAKTSEQKRTEKKQFAERFGNRLKAAMLKAAPLRSCKDNTTVRAWKAKLDAATDPRKG